MKRSLVVLPLALALAGEAQAQQATVHFKTLQEALPTADLPGFTRSKPTGSMQKAMGMATSEASVQYVKQGGAHGAISITAKIADVAGIPFGGMAMAVVPQVDAESETEHGYQKTATVKSKYKATEEAQTGDSKSCKLTIPVANRFMVEIEGSGTSDVKLLYALADSMALDKLEATSATK